MAPLLEIKNLSKSFINTDKHPVSIINVKHFALSLGEHIGIEGSSGCGKTTFLNLIAGILKPDYGDIIFQGENVACFSESRRDTWRAMHIGYVFQTFNLLQGYSALENVSLGMAFSGKGVDIGFAKELLYRVGLSTHLHHLPKQMSIGQQQRVAVARALANKPQLVLADEPTGNLDSVHAQATMALIKEICAEHNTALLFVSHDQVMLSMFKKRAKMTDINT